MAKGQKHLAVCTHCRRIIIDKFNGEKINFGTTQYENDHNSLVISYFLIEGGEKLFFFNSSILGQGFEGIHLILHIVRVKLTMDTLLKSLALAVNINEHTVR